VNEAIGFNHEVALVTIEVNNVGTYRMLATKLAALLFSVPQVLPEHLFGRGFKHSVIPGELEQDVLCLAVEGVLHGYAFVEISRFNGTEAGVAADGFQDKVVAAPERG
jgi:hypothetical protein